jgi:hypothetical protein
MQYKPPGIFSRGSIRIHPSPMLTPDALMMELQRAWGPQGYEVYKTALVGADLVLKKSAWTGLAIKINHAPQSTELLFNTLSPSLFVRLVALGIIPSLILQAGPWKRLLNEWQQSAQQFPPSHGPMSAGYGGQLPQQGYPQQGYPQQGYPQQGFGPGSGNPPHG